MLAHCGPLHGLCGPNKCLDVPWRGTQLPIPAKVFQRAHPRRRHDQAETYRN